MSKRLVFFQVYHQYHGFVRMLVAEKSPPVDVDDLVQEVFLRVWVTPTLHYDNEKQIRSWLRVVVKHARIAKWRKTQSRVQEVGDLQDVDIAIDDQLDDGHGLYMRGLATLPKIYQDPLRMLVFEGSSHAEIAERLNLNIGTVDSRLYRAKRKLREWGEN